MEDAMDRVDLQSRWQDNARNLELCSQLRTAAKSRNQRLIADAYLDFLQTQHIFLEEARSHIRKLLDQR